MRTWSEYRARAASFPVWRGRALGSAILTVGLAATVYTAFGSTPDEAPDAAVSTDWRDLLTEREIVALELGAEYLGELSETLDRFFRNAAPDDLRDMVEDQPALLQHAVRYAKDPAIIAYLIDAGFDPNVGFGRGVPAFPHDSGADLKEGPLHDAARYSAHPAIIAALGAGGADVKALGGYGLRTPLHYAARDGGPAIVQGLIDLGADVNAVNGRISQSYVRGSSRNGITPLHESAWNANADVVDVLIRGGADADARDTSGVAPLHWAVARDGLAAVGGLLRGGADANARISYPCGSDWACERGGDPRTGCEGCAPIHVAADPESVDGDGGPNRLAIVDALVAGGADVNARDACGLTPLHRAMSADPIRLEVAARLLGAGAQVNAYAVAEPEGRDCWNYGYSPLHEAAAARNGDGGDAVAVVRFLLDAGANANAMDPEGRSPADVARTDSIRDLLLADQPGTADAP